MKRKFIFLLFICMFLLCGCNSKKSITGQVVEVFHGTGSNDTQFVLHTKENEEIGIMLDDETQVWCFIDDIDAEDFKDGTVSNVMITVEYTGRSISMETPDNREIKAYIAKDIKIDTAITKDKLRLSDGTSVDMWETSFGVVYKVSNGTELVRVQNTPGPNDIVVVGLDNVTDLSDTAKSNILTFYKDQGLFYDLNSELESAYADYQQTETKSEFKSHMLSQDITLCTFNDSVMYFITTVNLPIDGYNLKQLRLGATFDRKTGKQINAWELFSCEKNEVIQTILDLAQVTDPVLRAEMEKAFSPENIVMFQNNLEVSFPKGTLPSQENGYTICLDYNEEISKILNIWAIPNHRE